LWSVPSTSAAGAILDLGYRQGEQAAGAAAELAGADVGLVAEPAGDLADALARRLRQATFAAQGVGHGRG
jgi:hypothetical protein